MEQRHVFSARPALNRDLLRRRLAAQSDAELRRQFLGTGRTGETLAVPDGLRDAAVLIPIINHVDGLTVLFTKRTLHLSKHAGQIAFPGGSVEPADAGPIATALRETHEEIGLDPARVDVLGRLRDHVTGTGFAIVPVVGMIDPPVVLTPDPNEVAETFEVPLEFLRDPANRHARFRAEPKPVHFFSIPYLDHNIWGATAQIVITLTELLDRQP
jgi:8-oxo-dGTP pyrophosphatase MutT (NUDIX family)